MGRGKSKSKLSRSERIESASHFFGRGFTDAEVARKLKIARNTATAYRAIYEEKLRNDVANNPQFLQDVIGNTNRMLGEQEQIRKAAWDEFQKADKKVKIVCEHCEETVVTILPDADLKVKLLNVAQKAQDSRAKLLGTIGVKAEVIAKIQAVEFVQNALLKFMAEKLCQHDREALVELLTSPALAPYMGADASVIEAESWEDAPAVSAVM